MSLAYYIGFAPPAQSTIFFFFNDTATTEIYTLSLHDALPIYRSPRPRGPAHARSGEALRSEGHPVPDPDHQDRKSTRLNSSHGYISYAVFCLKKKKTSILISDPHRPNH